MKLKIRLNRMIKILLNNKSKLLKKFKIYLEKNKQIKSTCVFKNFQINSTS